MTKLKNGLAIGAIMLALGVSGANANGNWPNLPLAGGGSAWAQSTVYAQGAYAKANGNTYQETVLSCTSAASGTGPSGNQSGPNIPDGSCLWAYVSPAYSTLPLTGGELVPADTNLNQGTAPQSERITTQLMAQFTSGGAAIAYVAATNTTAFTLSNTQVIPFAGSGEQVTALTGTLGAGAAVTTPTATALNGASYGVGSSFLFKLVNESSGAFAWTLTAGTGVTIVGTAAVAQNTSQTWLVTFPTATTATFTNVGN